MWVLLTAFVGSIVGPILWRVIGLLGFGLTVYVGLDSILLSVESEIQTLIGQLGSNVYTMLNVLGVITGINIVVSAFSARLLLMGVIAGGKTVFGYKS